MIRRFNMKEERPDSLVKLREIFEIVSDLPEAERAGKLEELCGENDKLRGEVEELLDAGERVGKFLSEPEISPDDALFAPLGFEEGSTIGKYRLLEQIGEGANAVVYMVEQVETLKRRAALKVIKLGMDTREVIARFETERQALAMMDHPNIAKVLDAGSTHSGRPYFVMELVKGIPITEYCDKNRLSTKERLELFIVVCQALQHAHLKGLIHRDVKPSNVLVTLHDGAPVPKVIDFGIAKATESRLTDKTLFTRFHQFIGTPAYMSPEQAEMSGLDIDTRSDIYSLGVLLYELLTGSTPFDGRELLESGYAEIQRVIREREPERPSTRLGTLSAEGLTAVSKSRSIQPGEICSGVKGDLDWIVMKALEKDRTRRYETASEFIRDVRRHLDNEPVEAGRPSRAYRVKKFVQRHKPAVIAGVAVVVSLISALAIASYGLVKAKQEAEDARRQAEKADTVTQLLDEMFQSAIPGSSKGEDYTVRNLLDDFSSRVSGQLSSEPEVEMTLRRTIGIAYEGLGEYVTAETHLRRARDLALGIYEENSAEVLELESRLGWLTLELGSAKGALASLEKTAEGQLKVLGETHPDYLRTLGLLAAVKLETGDSEGAEELATMVLATPEQSDGPWMMQVLMKAYRNQGKDAKAERLSTRLVSLTDVAKDSGDPRTFEAIHTAVLEQMEDGEYQAAEELLRRSIETARRTLSDDHRMTLVLLGDLGQVVLHRGEKEEAATIFERVLELQKETVGEQHQDTIQTMLALVGLRLDQDENLEAESMAREVFLNATRRFGEESEVTIESVCKLAQAMQRQGKYTEAEASLKQVYTTSKRVFGEDHATTMLCLRRLADLKMKRDNWLDAQRYLRRLVEHSLKEHGEESSEYQTNLADLSEVLEKLYRYQEAQDLRSRLVDLRGSIEDQRRLAVLYRKRSIVGPAIELLEEAHARAVKADGEDSEVALRVLVDLAEAYSISNNNKKALELLKSGRALAFESLGPRAYLSRKFESADNSLSKTHGGRMRAEQRTRASYENALESGQRVRTAWVYWFEALTILQDDEASEKEAIRFLEEAKESGDRERIFDARSRAAWNAQMRSQHEEAEQRFRELLKDLMEAYQLGHARVVRTLELYTALLLRQGKVEEVDALLDSWQDKLTDSIWEESQVLSPRGERWLFLHHERDEGAKWKAFGPEVIPSRAGSRWFEGLAPFGYGIVGAATLPIHQLNSISHTTHYFRREFLVDDPGKYSALKIRLRREGGAAVYLNGEEVVRDNLAPDAAFDTPSGGERFLDRYVGQVFVIGADKLREGENIIAVEVHQESPDSTDMAFDLELSGKLKKETVK